MLCLPLELARTLPNPRLGLPVLLLGTSLFLGPAGVAHAQFMPQPDPPVLEPMEDPTEGRRVAPDFVPPSAAPTTEWADHKSADSVHPNDGEQKMRRLGPWIR